MRRHRRHAAVEGDLRRAARWYERRVAGLGSRFLDAAESGVEAIVANPQAWSRMPGLPHELDVRRYMLFPPFPYYIAYIIKEGDEAVILAVVHSKRLPRSWLRRVERTR